MKRKIFFGIYQKNRKFIFYICIFNLITKHMKKNFTKMAIIAIAALTMSMTAQAQMPTFNNGDNLVSFGIGFGGYYTGAFYNNASSIPAISFYYEKCVKDNLFDDKSSLGIGGMVGYTSAKWSDYWKVSNTVIGVRGALHYAFVDKLDTYAGLMLGYNIVSWNYYSSWIGGSSNSSSAVVLSGFLGARYYFTDNVAAFAEVGYGVANINLGLSLKF